MEHVVNAKLRNQAFWKFIFFFTITTVIIVTSVYFDYDLPNRENTMLRGKIDNYETQAYNQQQFITGLDTAKKLIDRMTKEGYNALMDRDIATRIEKLSHPEYLNNSMYTSMNQVLYLTLSDYYDLNSKYMKSNDKSQEVDSLKDELNRLQNRYDQLQNSLEISRRSQNLN